MDTDEAAELAGDERWRELARLIDAGRITNAADVSKTLYVATSHPLSDGNND